MSEIETMKQNFYIDLAKELDIKEPEKIVKFCSAISAMVRTKNLREKVINSTEFKKGFERALEMFKEETVNAISIIEINRVD